MNVRSAHLACLLEATARKPGNVHPQASFDDLTYDDFVRSAQAAAPAFERAAERGVGPTVLDAIERTRRAVARNTNLGIVLLLAPLACVPPARRLRDGIRDVLSTLSRTDAECVYRAIRLANPGGMGRVEAEDIAGIPSVTLLEAMRLAADRDQIAAQYVNDFALVFAGVDRLTARGLFPNCWEDAVIDLQLWLLTECPDTLIARKCGPAVAEEASRRAQFVLQAGWPDGQAARPLLAEFDAWLRADGHRRNPGTSADLVTACLFAAFRDGGL